MEMSCLTMRPALSLLHFHTHSHRSIFFFQIPRMVKVVEESSPYFKVISPKDIGHKVAPGVPSIFRILFTPEENKVTAVLARNWSHAFTSGLQF